jgi:hypothetical protein
MAVALCRIISSKVIGMVKASVTSTGVLDDDDASTLVVFSSVVLMASKVRPNDCTLLVVVE